MSEMESKDGKEQNPINSAPTDQVDGEPSADESNQMEVQDNPVPSLNQEEETIRKKYGGLLPKKPPLISKDHERAFFDSADWALRKQGEQKTKEPPPETLRPKLQPTPHLQLRARRAAYTSEIDGAEVTVEESNDNDTTREVGEDQSALGNDGSSRAHSHTESCCN